MSKRSSGFASSDSDINQLILDIYASSALLSVEQYRRWALDQLRRRLDFDHATWGSGSLKTNRVHDLIQIGTGNEAQPQGTLDDWLEHRDRSDSRRQQVVVEREGAADLVRFICVTSRAGGKLAASARALLELLVPHLLSGWRQCQSFYLLRRRARSKHDSAAIIDSEGWVQCAEPSFFGLLPLASSNETHRIPAALHSLAHGEQGEVIFGGARWVAAPIEDLTYLAAFPLGPIAKLTGREQTVVKLIVAGQSYAQSAADLGISTNTVRNTLVRVYRKLGVRNKLELAQRASPTRSSANGDSFELR